MFFGLGADGTVGANKNSIKIIGEETDNFAQGYFVYDSKKSGAMTISHLRFGPRPIHAPYLVTRAGFIACHQYEQLDSYDVLAAAEPGAVFLLNAPFGPDEIWDELSENVQATIIERRLRFFVIDAYAVARAVGMGTRINTIMQTCFFAISGVLPRDEAIGQIKDRHPQDLQQARPGGRQRQLRRGRPYARASARSAGAGINHFDAAPRRTRWRPRRRPL